MPKSTLLLILFFVLILIFGIMERLGYISLDVSIPFFSNTNEENSGFSPFREALLPEKDYNKASLEFVGEFSAIKHASEEAPNFWESWNWEETMIFGDVVGVDKEENLILLNISLPKDLEISSKDISSKVLCSFLQTAQFSTRNRKYVRGNFDLIAVASSGDKLYTYCMKPDCSEIGRMCILIR